MKKIKINCGDCKLFEHCNNCTQYKSGVLMRNKLGFLDDTAAIDGVVDQLVSHSDNPQGYPINKITIYHASCVNEHFLLTRDFYTSRYRELELDSIYFEFKTRCIELEIKPPENLQDMKILNFKTAGKILKDKTQIVKKELSLEKYKIEKEDYIFDCGIKLHQSHIRTKTLLDCINEKDRKTTGNRRALVAVDYSKTKETEDMWEAIKYKKKVKKIITEEWNYDLGVDFDVSLENFNKTPDPERIRISGITIDLLEDRWVKGISEKTYQALQRYGAQVFYNTLTTARIPTRKQLAEKYLY